MSENVVYLDVLILINTFVTYCLLISTKMILNIHSTKLRLVIASIIGGAFSMIILVNSKHAIILNILKLVVATIMVLVSFYQKNLKHNIRNIVVFYLVNFIYAGLMFALWYFVTPPQMLFKNGVVYFDISALFLAFSTIVSYLAIKVFCYYFAKKPSKNQSARVEISVDGNSLELSGFIDTGNRLMDIITGLPIILCDFEKIKGIIPKQIHDKLNITNLQDITNPLWKKRLRVIPTKTIDRAGMIVCFKPDMCQISIDDKKIKTDVLIGMLNTQIMDGEYDVIINNSIIVD